MELREDLTPIKRRSAAVTLTIIVAFGALFLRLIQLQVLETDEWRRRAENNRLRELPLSSQRGRIYDRSGLVLADNLPTWDLLLFPDEARDLDDTVFFLARERIAQATGLRQHIETRRIGRLAPLVAAENLSWEQVSRIRSHQSDHPELAVVSSFRRFYPAGTVAAHAVGHLRMVTQEEIESHPDLDPNALVGAVGIEALYNDFLSGTDGHRLVVASAVGRQLGVVTEQNAIPGRDLGTTLDLRLQRVAADALGEAAGTVVAIEPATGAVRVLYSAPGFDPNVFVGRMSRSEWRQLSEDPEHPLQNRAIQGVYPPGSTIKPFFAIAGLSEGVITPSWSVNCRGSVVLYGHRFRCWRRSGHGRAALTRSLEVSCDTFYYLLGQRLGIEGMARWLRTFGFSSRTGIGFATEAAGLIGTPEWSERVRGTPWYPGEAVSLSIGQGPLLVTTLQLARAYAALANGGRLMTPYLVEPVVPPTPVDLGLDPAYLADVVEGLRLVTHGSEGTARSLAALPVAGKTGTAQVARLQEDSKVDDLPVHLRHHAWFVGWVPLDEPRLVVAVIVEHGGGGAGVAAPVAKAVFQAVMKLDRPRDVPG